MIASWSDSDSSELESEEEQANLCLAAEQEDPIEVTVRNVLSSPIEVISEVLKEMFKNEECYLSEIKLLKNQVLEQTKENFDLIFKSKELEISQTKSDKDLKALTDNFKALKSQVKNVVPENSLLQDEFVSLKHQYGELEKQKIQVCEKLEISKRNWERYSKS